MGLPRIRSAPRLAAKQQNGPSGRSTRRSPRNMSPSRSQNNEPSSSTAVFDQYLANDAGIDTTPPFTSRHGPHKGSPSKQPPSIDLLQWESDAEDSQDELGLGDPAHLFGHHGHHHHRHDDHHHHHHSHTKPDQTTHKPDHIISTKKETVHSKALEAMHTHDHQAQPWNSKMVIYLGLIHAGAAMGLYNLPQMTSPLYTMGWFVLTWFFCELGITAGAHRLWSHRSFTAHGSVRFFLMCCQSMAMQGNIYHWARDHRVHHKFTETDADPHNAERGFWFSHMGWLMEKKHPEVTKKGKLLHFDDILDDVWVKFQLKCDPVWSLVWCFAFPTYMAMQTGEQMWTALWVVGFLRYVFSLHCTWLVNSAAHKWGDRPYAPEIYSAENAWVAFLTQGEGWHNWHHAFPYDYRAAELGVLKRYNPTTLFIDACAALGLVTHRKTATKVWKLRKHRMQEEEDDGEPLLSTTQQG